MYCGCVSVKGQKKVKGHALCVNIATFIGATLYGSQVMCVASSSAWVQVVGWACP
jgi:hypothetical protein